MKQQQSDRTWLASKNVDVSAEMRRLRQHIEASVYEDWKQIVAIDPLVLKAAQQKGELTLEWDLLLERYELAEELAYRLHARKILVAHGPRHMRRYSVRNLLTAVGAERYGAQAAFRGELAPRSGDQGEYKPSEQDEHDRYIFEVFCDWELGGNQEARDFLHLMALARESLRRFLGVRHVNPTQQDRKADLADLRKENYSFKLADQMLTSGDFKATVTTRFFPLRPTALLAKAKGYREWESFWVPIIDLVEVCNRAKITNAISKGVTFKLFHLLFPKTLKSHDLFDIGEIFEAFGRELERAVADGRLSYSMYAPVIGADLLGKVRTIIDLCMEGEGTDYTTEDHLTPVIDIGQGRPVGKHEVRREFEERAGSTGATREQFVVEAEALAEAVRPGNKSAEIAQLERILKSAQESAPEDTLHFAELVNRILADSNYCLKLSTGERARRIMPDRNGFLVVQCTIGGNRGFKNAQWQLIPYVRSYKRPDPPPPPDSSLRLS